MWRVEVGLGLRGSREATVRPADFHVTRDNPIGPCMTVPHDCPPADPGLTGGLGLDLEFGETEVLPPVPGSRDPESEGANRRRSENEIGRAPNPKESPHHRLSLALAG